ncbi:hypothetical protein [Gimesia fumaroli]|uniref:Uncharacterized protein n=1 Tax=Gimesia fumaroli TaxID=2527976 RepID=A0A518I998_9PLAN|nr:hypothetical protein [Gimesia fumaroli]QDV49686.1 hypothetical protein Enr17x_17070 [Gimesia fumaroli]
MIRSLGAFEPEFDQRSVNEGREAERFIFTDRWEAIVRNDGRIAG